MGPAILSGSMAIPKGLIDAAAIQSLMTVKYEPMGAEEPLYLELARDDGEYLHVPRQYGLDLCTKFEIDYIDQTSAGKIAKFPKVPKPRDYQEEPLDKLEELCNDYYDFLFRARTGWGKTIGSLILAARLGRTTLVVVDQDNLKKQWIDALTKHFGFRLDQIGIIQGKECSYEGKAVTIAMVQTLSQKDYPAELYHAFGLLLVDETHIIGAPTFSTILPKISAMYRIGVSATPKRKDGLQKVLTFNLGKVRLYLEDEHDASSVCVLYHDTVYSWYANTNPKIGRFLTEISEDGSRNFLAAEAACFLYETGRDTLVLSDRIEQLRGIQDLCYYLGVPDEEMGLISGTAPVYRFQKDPSPKRRPIGYERGTEYTPIILKLVSKRVKDSTVEDAKKNAKLLFATYGKCAKGFDLPRLNAGVDATPRSESEQVQGRILRILEGKLKALWITIADRCSYRSMYSLSSRIAGYTKNNAALYEGGLSEGWNQCNAKELKSRALAEVALLKSMRIEPTSDGRNMLVTPSQRMRREAHRVKSTIKAIVRRRSSPTGS